MTRPAPRPSEKILVDSAISFLANEGFAVFTEVPSLGKSVDLVARSGKTALFAEAKFSDWKRALRQCQAHELVADFICIILGTDAIAGELIQHASAKGYGIIHSSRRLERSCEWVLHPVKNPHVWGPQRERWECQFREVFGVN
jgi:hypothetical protein